jgi:hypothetical protein
MTVQCNTFLKLVVCILLRVLGQVALDGNPEPDVILSVCFIKDYAKMVSSSEPRQRTLLCKRLHDLTIRLVYYFAESRYEYRDI